MNILRLCFVALFMSCFAMVPIKSQGQESNGTTLPNPQNDAVLKFQNPFNRSRDRSESKPPRKRLGKSEISFATVKVDQTDDELQRLRKERFNEAVKEVQARLEQFRVGRTPLSSAHDAATRMLKSESKVTRDVKQREAFFENFGLLANDLATFAELNLKMGTGTVQEAHLANYLRIEGKIRHLKFKRSHENAPAKD